MGDVLVDLGIVLVPALAGLGALAGTLFACLASAVLTLPVWGLLQLRRYISG